MNLDRIALALTPSWRDEKLVLVRATDAVRLCREGGYEAVPPWRVDYPDRRDMHALREFVAHAHLSRFPLSFLDDGEVLALLRRSIESREMVVLRQSEGARVEPGSATAEQRRLIREIERLTQGRLNYSGRRYKLVADADLAKQPDRDSFEVVRHDDAVKILDAVAKEAGATADPGGTFGQAKEKLTRDWRPPVAPDGLILLRKIISQRDTSVDVAETITPSQMKKMMTKTEWIEIVVIDDLGKPYTGPYRIALPDGSVREGNFDEQGLWGDYDIDPGNCKLLLPDIPEAVKPAVTASAWVALKLVDDDGKPVEGRAYKLKLPDGSERTGTTGEAETRVDGIAPGTCVFSLPADDAGGSG